MAEVRLAVGDQEVELGEARRNMQLCFQRKVESENLPYTQEGMDALVDLAYSCMKEHWPEGWPVKIVRRPSLNDPLSQEWPSPWRMGWRERLFDSIGIRSRLRTWNDLREGCYLDREVGHVAGVAYAPLFINQSKMMELLRITFHPSPHWEMRTWEAHGPSTIDQIPNRLSS